MIRTDGEARLQDASQWRYIGEGGENALFQDVSSSSSSGCLLLRIRKRDLAVADNHPVDLPQLVANRPKSSYYLESVVAPCLASYIDIPEVVPLQWSFLKKLKQQTLNAGCIPEARRKDWSCDSGTSSSTPTIASSPPQAKLLYDYRYFQSPAKSKSGCCLSIEFKPKAGYVAFSPLVRNRIKYQSSRFELLQKLHQQGKITKPWAKPTNRQDICHYDPIDLYSSSTERMKTALHNLFHCPQNFLKVYYNATTKLVGSKAVNKNRAEDLCRDEIIPNLVGTQTAMPAAATETVQNMLVECMVAILHQESLLPQLLKLQELDILDADGAIWVYNHLVELCGGSHEEAQELLDHGFTTEPSEATFSLLEATPFSIPKDHGATSSVLAAMCENIAAFRQLLMKLAPNLPPQQQMDEYHELVRSQIPLLNSAECRFLLWNWLLSLAMCDVSMFITLQPIEPASAAQGSGVPTVSPSGKGGSGMVTYSSWNDKPIAFAYRVRLIDCYGKPSRKLKSRQKKEEAFDTLSPTENS
eukprot:scaffold2830_cov131-Cylindrotheca_fusiformis.AAC.18